MRSFLQSVGSGIAIITGLLALNAPQSSAQLVPIGTYRDGAFAQDPSASEIVAHDPATQRLFVVNGYRNRIDILSISNPTNPTLIDSIPLGSYGAGPNSVAVKNGIVAVAVEANPKTSNGKAVFFNTSGTYINQVTVGALPDMIIFTPDNKYVLTANEGEPNDAYTIDPNGSVSIINITGGIAGLTAANVTTIDFSGYTAAQAAALGVRLSGPNANSPAKDIEPEYITISSNSLTAWVSLQENNAIAVINIPTATITSLYGLGYKDHKLSRNKLDASDRDTPGSSNVGIINIRNWPVFGMYQPDGIASYEHMGQTYIVTANEGDSRDYGGFSEEVRVGSLTLDAASFTAQGYSDVGTTTTGLRHNDNLGRLTVTSTMGNYDADADYDSLFVFGARSFSIRTASGALVYDSGDDFEQITAAQYPTQFNSNNDDNNSFDTRSDNKGPEPETVTIARMGGFVYALIGLERMSGIMVYDITNPNAPFFVTYVNNRNFAAAANTAAAGDLGPEGLIFIPAAESPNGMPLVVTANEVSGTTTLFQLLPTADGRLPVELVGFDAAYDHGNVFVSWQTASESDNLGFEVERATASNDPDYSPIASYLTVPELRGLGTSSSGKTYSYTDDASLLTPGNEYLYRLVDISADGIRTAHEPKRVLIADKAAPGDVARFRLTALTPNPVSDAFTMSFVVPEPGVVTIELYGEDGRRISVPVDAKHVSADEQTVELSAVGLAPGIYTARIIFGSMSRARRFVVVR